MSGMPTVVWSQAAMRENVRASSSVNRIASVWVRFRDAMDHGGAEDVEVRHDPSGEVDRFIDCERLKSGFADLPYGCARS